MLDFLEQHHHTIFQALMYLICASFLVFFFLNSEVRSGRWAVLLRWQLPVIWFASCGLTMYLAWIHEPILHDAFNLSVVAIVPMIVMVLYWRHGSSRQSTRSGNTTA